MIFLIEYDRGKGKVVFQKEFTNSEKDKAEELKLKMELKLNHDKLNHEVVLLDAVNEGVLHRTHRRYFDSLGVIVNSAGTLFISRIKPQE